MHEGCTKTVKLTHENSKNGRKESTSKRLHERARHPNLLYVQAERGARSSLPGLAINYVQHRIANIIRFQQQVLQSAQVFSKENPLPDWSDSGLSDGQ